MSFFQNTCKPEGLGGKIMVQMMNNGHAQMAEWGFSHLTVKEDASVLDAGCGGGANVAVWLTMCKKGHVTGLDYSEVSVNNSKKKNAAAIEEKRCEILQDNVLNMPFENSSFDAVSAFETIYFWPEIDRAFREVYRVVKGGGHFMICNELDGTTSADEKWTDKIEGMKIYNEEQVRKFMEAAGFVNIKAYHTPKHWMCLIGDKSE